MKEDTSNSTTLGFSERLTAASPRVEAVETIPTLTIIYHPDLTRIGERLAMSELPAGRAVAVSRRQPAFALSDGRIGKPLNDPFISRGPLRFQAGPRGEVILDATDCRTSLSIGGSPVEQTVSFPRNQLEYGVIMLLAERVVLLLSLRPPIQAKRPPDHDLVGDSHALFLVKQAIMQVADLDVPVLLRGESGSGKELVARAIHQAGPRSRGPFISVNLGTVTPSLAASELFGSTKGAFTGAHQVRRGLFQRAHGGALFLDEVGEAPPDVQVMLLRVLETGEILPVGGDHPQRVDVRIVAATDANLEAMAQSKDFRAPLLHRLAGFELRLPPLRERREDIGLLLRFFLQKELTDIGEAGRLTPTQPKQEPWLPASLVVRLCAYDWPGNIREFRNVLRQIVISSRGKDRSVIDKVIAEKLTPTTTTPAAPASEAGPTQMAALRKPAGISEGELLEALALARWDLEAAAKRLNVARSSLYRLIRKSPEIRTAADLSAEEITACHRRLRGDLSAMVDELRVSGKALKRRVYELGLQSRDPGGDGV